ncbi:MAG TPA: hypothetical protein VK256_04495 [Candidatus Eisenbacteria bacterium]|nr:hypothetical protein [Candidatus Eisenbacteria bacterium]
MLFATRHWAGSRGVFLGVSGLMIGVAASSALLLPFLRATAGTRRLMGMSVEKYTYFSTSLAIGIAAVLGVAAVAAPQ